MGCWNETCAVTGLAIRNGDRARVFVLERQRYYKGVEYGGGFSNPDDLWRPRYFPILGTYGDYGVLEALHEDLNTRVLVHDLDRRMVKDARHADETQGEHTPLEKYLRLIERGIARIRQPGDLGCMLVLEDVYQAMVKEGRLKPLYEGIGPGSLSVVDYEPWYYINALREMGYKVKVPALLELKAYEKDSPELAPLREKTEGYLRFSNSLERLRKHYAPQSGKGSQDVDDELVENVSILVQDIIEQRRMVE